MVAAGAMVTLRADEVPVRAVGVPESVNVKIRLLYVPAHDAVGAVPDVVVSTPAELRVRHAGSALPVLETAQFLYGGMPPLPCKVTENAVPTPPMRLVLVVVTASLAGTVIVTVPVCVDFATEVAVMVMLCDELVAAGAV
jgi:hypothetical protein